MADTVAYVRSVEQLLIGTLADLGLPDVGRLADYPGVWVAPASAEPRKIAAIGVRLSRGRSMHGFALNVDPDMRYFDWIVPCGIRGKTVTSLVREGIDVSMRDVVEAISDRAVERWGHAAVTRAGVAWRVRPEDLSAFSRRAATNRENGHRSGETTVRLRGRLAEAGVGDGLAVRERKPEWMRVKADFGAEYRRLDSIMHGLDLRTVCREAGCPNIYECWNDGTATFMINGDRCTRACGFCLVDTRKPRPLDADEPARVAAAVDQMALSYAVITAVARDDLADGGATGFAQTIDAIRERCPGTQVEVLIPDCQGDESSLDVIFDRRPDVLNHNIETVARLQRAVRPSASYARSLAVLARAKAAGLTTKSSIIVGMGETFDEVVECMADLRSVGVDIVTVGQYLRPTADHVPVARWWTPDEFDAIARIGERELGIGHVEASPLTRSSYHAKSAAARSGAR